MTVAASRPLRFVVVLLGGWISVRAMLLWPSGGPLPALVAAIAPPVAAAPMSAPNATPVAPPRASRRMAVIAAHPARYPSEPLPAIATPRNLDPVLETRTAPVPSKPSEARPGPRPGTQRRQPIFTDAPRLSGSGWVIVRSGGIATPFTPQLGGSQAGIRLTYALGDARRVSLAARFSSALGSRQREAAVGLDWRPTALPIHLIAEQRIGVEQARGGPSLALIGGIGPTRVAGDVHIEAYGQAGGIARGGIEGFADGAVRLTKPVATPGPATIDLGIGAWGGAQRGAARLDVGPAASVALPAAGRTLRLSLEWRQRIAGRARPGSGPALSIGTDF